MRRRLDVDWCHAADGTVWNSTELSYYVDDTVYVRVDSPGKDFAQKPFYWILNTAVGGA